MKKIMFNDRFGLTQAVLEGRKTMMRRVVTDGIIRMAKMEVNIHGGELTERIKDHTPYCYLDEVAVAQSYEDINEYLTAMQRCIIKPFGSPKEDAGWTNKMFIKANLMPHHIRITDIKVERLQDISDDDCLREGVFRVDNQPKHMHVRGYAFTFKGWWEQQGRFTKQSDTPRGAFAALIDKINGKGTWARNPYVFAYTFEHVEKGGLQ